MAGPVSHAIKQLKQDKAALQAQLQAALDKIKNDAPLLMDAEDLEELKSVPVTINK